MIVLTIGQTVLLHNGALFKCTAPGQIVHLGEVSHGNMWFRAYMNSITGSVKDTLTATEYSKYTPPQAPPALPVSPGQAFRDMYSLDSAGWIGWPTIIFKEKTCNCGGFKTYNSMADHYHSRWCKSITGVD